MTERTTDTPNPRCHHCGRDLPPGPDIPLCQESANAGNRRQPDRPPSKGKTPGRPENG